MDHPTPSTGVQGGQLAPGGSSVYVTLSAGPVLRGASHTHMPVRQCTSVVTHAFAAGAHSRRHMTVPTMLHRLPAQQYHCTLVLLLLVLVLPCPLNPDPRGSTCWPLLQARIKGPPAAGHAPRAPAVLAVTGVQ
jgi:hypothetical protein